MSTLFRWLLAATVLLSFGCTGPKSGTAIFPHFTYTGSDASFDRRIDPANEFFNPVLAGFYPDPSICRKGDDYFLVNSSFVYYPGVPIFHSRDLASWRQIGYVLDRPSQLATESIRIDGGIYAPAITYNLHNDTFYMITTCVDGIGNFIVKCKDPLAGNWSDPIPLPRVGGIDPSLFFDDDGRGYIVHNDAPATEPEWSGHRAIWIHDFDPATDTTFGERQVLLDGGVDRSTKPVWIEGPHIYKVGGKYYLMAAEGGTCEYHSEVILRADHVKGPYIPYAGNPILTQRDMPGDRADKITSVGHADLIDTPSGEWYAVFLGCRPYEGDHYHTGRETFLLPVTWRDGFPVILPAGEPLPVVVRKEGLQPAAEPLTGNFSWHTDFSEGIDQRWLMLRTPRDKWWETSEQGLTLTVTDRTLDERTNPAFLGHRQQHMRFEAETGMRFTPDEGEIAGLACFQNEDHYLLLGKTLLDGKEAIVVVRADGQRETIASFAIPRELRHTPVTLKIAGDKGSYSFYAAFGDTVYPIAEQVDARLLSTRSAGGFTGVVVGPYAGVLK